MPNDINSKLQRHARQQRLKQFALLFGVGGAGLAVMALVLPRYFAWTTNPLAETYFPASVVSVEVLPGGSGDIYEIVARFEGLQKMFRTTDFKVIEALPGSVCIRQTRGVYIGDGVPRARYHALADPAKCALL